MMIDSLPIHPYAPQSTNMHKSRKGFFQLDIKGVKTKSKQIIANVLPFDIKADERPGGFNWEGVKANKDKNAKTNSRCKRQTKSAYQAGLTRPAFFKLEGVKAKKRLKDKQTNGKRLSLFLV